MSIIGNIGGQSGGGYGATLTVVSPGPGNKITLSKDGKTREKVTGENGKAVFRGLSTGTWHRVMRNDSDLPAEMDIKIVADYEDIASYFRATINVTYPAGSICTATCGETTLTAPDTSGTWACIVPKAGEWTVTASTIEGGKTKSVVVQIESDGQTESVLVAYVLTILDAANNIDLTGTDNWETRATNGEEKDTSTYHQAGVGRCIKVSGYGARDVWTSEVDFHGYTTLEVTRKYPGLDDAQAIIGVSKRGSESDIVKIEKMSSPVLAGTSTLQVDVSKVQAYASIHFSFGAWPGNSKVASISEIILK